MKNETKKLKTHSGYIAIVGRPNVGKSTLLNAMVGQKISITARKPQTTRHCILGIKSNAQDQFIFVDTPGIFLAPKLAMNKMMVSKATQTINDVDVIIFVIIAGQWLETDEHVLTQLKGSTCPIIVAINKIDRLSDKNILLPYIDKLQSKLNACNFKHYEIIPIAASKHTNLSALENLIATYLPEGPHFFPDEQVTDKSERFIAAELIREKLIRLLGQEVPHALTVEIDEFKHKEDMLHINAIIWVERKGQKIIVIGDKGNKLKEIGRQARLDIEHQFSTKVFLRLWVKIKEGWTNDQRALQSLGYGE